MLAARRRQKTPYQFLDARVDVPTIKSARPDDGVRGTGPSRKIISLVGILLVEAPRARAGDDARLLVVVAGSRLRSFEFLRWWSAVLRFEPFEERAARGRAARWRCPAAARSPSPRLRAAAART